jgi:hypothetical protein
MTVIVDPRTLRTADDDEPSRDTNTDQLIEDPYLRCLAACVNAARESSARVESCLQSNRLPQLIACVDAAMRCADICQATGWAVTRHVDQPHGLLGHLLRACAQACRLCREGCPAHSDGDQHPRAWEQACLRCEEACHELLAALPEQITR